MAFYLIHLWSWSWLGSSMGLGLWFDIGIVAAGLQTVWHYTLIRGRSREGCFKAFRLNHWVGFAVFAGTAVDLGLR
jgi:4-hydroxybenzoate polyprenyltransferase